MIEILLITTLALGLSESIEDRLPEDPGMIYTVGFKHDGVKVGLDWKNRQIVPARVCRKATALEKPRCQQAAISWLKAECAYYGDKGALTAKQKHMQAAVCQGAKDVAEMVRARQVAER